MAYVYHDAFTGRGNCPVSTPCNEGALIHWMLFLYITVSFLAEGALSHEIVTISPHETLAIKKKGASC